jgi:hypothetical protein
MQKINEYQIVSSGRPVRPEGHPDLFWYRPGYAIIVGQANSYLYSGTPLPNIPLSGSLISGAFNPAFSAIPTAKEEAAATDTALKKISDALQTQIAADKAQAEKDTVVMAANAATASAIAAEAFKPRPDVPQLSDISIISNEKYFDEIGKERAKIVLKIKNSSRLKEDISGVDARIYQPRGA